MLVVAIAEVPGEDNRQRDALARADLHRGPWSRSDAAQQAQYTVHGESLMERTARRLHGSAARG